MPPAPARIARTPRQSSSTCWNPAVPPPPVPGASAGNWLAGDCGAGDAGDCGAGEAGDCEAGDAALGLGGGALDGGAVLGVEVLGVEVLGVPLAETVGVAGLDPPAGNEGGVVGVPDEQADTDAVVSMVKAAQPSTVPRTRRQPQR